MKHAWILAILTASVFAQVPTVPAAVKQAIAASVKASNSANATDTQGGYHEEGGIWGLTTTGTLVVIPAKAGPTNIKCGEGASIIVGDAVDPSLDADLVTVLGEWHVHPSGKRDGCIFVQPPSSQDISNVLGNPCNIVIGADNNTVYFYDAKGVIGKTKLKEFLKGGAL